MATLKATFEKSVKNLTELQKLINELSFWNKEGQNIYTSNQSGIMGDKNTQQLSNCLTYEEFAIDCISKELKSLLPSFKTGKGSNHIWISEDGNERNVLINF